MPIPLCNYKLREDSFEALVWGEELSEASLSAKLTRYDWPN